MRSTINLDRQTDRQRIATCSEGDKWETVFIVGLQEKKECKELYFSHVETEMPNTHQLRTWAQNRAELTNGNKYLAVNNLEFEIEVIYPDEIPLEQM